MVGKCAATQNAADTELESLVRGNVLSFAGVGLRTYKIHPWVLHTGQTSPISVRFVYI